MWAVLGAAVPAAIATYVYFNDGKPRPKALPQAKIITSEAEVPGLVASVAANNRKWKELPVAKKLAYLKEIRENLKYVVDEVVDASDTVRGCKGTPYAGFSGVFSIVGACSFVDGLITLYESLLKTGSPPQFLSKRKVKDVEVAVTAPLKTLWHSLSQPNKIELWSEPGKLLTQRNSVFSDDNSGICAVLNPGNFEAPNDILYKMFIHSQVVVSKSHPVNAISFDLLVSKVFYSLVRDGFLGLVSGKAELGGVLLHDPHTTSWMITGGCSTFDAIVWGPPSVREENKKNNTPVLSKKCDAELGAVSPWIVLPGPWSAKEIEIQAKTLVSSKKVNEGHVCASPQVVVLDRSWNLSKAFIQEVEKLLNTCGHIKPYYPGSEERMAAIKQNCPSAKYFSNSNVLFVEDVDAEGGGGNYCLQTEFFVGGLAVKYIDSKNQLDSYLSQAASLVNEKFFGSLSCNVIVHPQTEKQLGQKLDEFIYDLNWGTVSVNTWAVNVATNPFATWGAPTNRHSDRDIQSGKGKQGNVVLAENINKSVVRGQWCAKVPLFPSTAGSRLYRAFTDFFAYSSVNSFCKLIIAVNAIE